MAPSWLVTDRGILLIPKEPVITEKRQRTFPFTMIYQPSETKFYRPISFRYAFSHEHMEDPRKLDEDRIAVERSTFAKEYR